MTEPSFPPLFHGQAVDGSIDPFAKACTQAVLGCDSGLVVYNLAADRLGAAIVFAPEVALEEAVSMMPVCGIGFQNALGALAPPEVAVHLDWQGGIRVNGASCGRLRMAASTGMPEEQPDWLVVGLEVPLLPTTDAPGDVPDQTVLHLEGCAEIEPQQLLESWVRHTLVWLNHWQDGELNRIHDEWRGLAQGLGEDIEVDGEQGVFLGLDERFGLLLRQSDDTRLIPLSTRLEGV
ncbi:biotin/lipoate--protein ligase family protein [Coralliovum pocilloporae]|uniref:biotin/lipoate--protein ligase family protein n=1 Tax=Coralliovum pocilloporae TaxID=3066369 RepID=UPI0033077238